MALYVGRLPQHYVNVLLPTSPWQWTKWSMTAHLKTSNGRDKVSRHDGIKSITPYIFVYGDQNLPTTSEKVLKQLIVKLKSEERTSQRSS